jgi:membrane associated rhomboid family serine protease
VIYAAIFLLPGSSVYIFFIPIPIPAAVYAIAFLVISIWGIRSRFGNIGHDAHVGGALVGLLVTTVLYPEVILAQPLLFLAVTGISLGLMVWLIRRDRAL